MIKATSCEPPEIKLGNYLNEIKGLKASNTIWTPDKAKSMPKIDVNKNNEVTPEKIFEILLKTTQIDLSDLLVEKESNRMLSQLLDQVNALGMTIQEYLDSRGRTQVQIRETYRKSAESSLKLEFILNQISLDNKIVVSEKEIEDFLAKSKDLDKSKFSSPAQKNMLGIILRKQKTLDFLRNL